MSMTACLEATMDLMFVKSPGLKCFKVCGVCLRVRVCVRACVHTCMYSGQRLNLSIFLSLSFSALVFETGSLLEPGLL